MSITIIIKYTAESQDRATEIVGWYSSPNNSVKITQTIARLHINIEDTKAVNIDALIDEIQSYLDVS